MRVVILQSRDITPRVPPGCVVIEDYPVYVDPDSVNKFPEHTTVPDITDDVPETVVPDTDRLTENIPPVTLPSDNGDANYPDTPNTGGAVVSVIVDTGSTGAEIQIDGDGDSIGDYGIPARDGSVITVDNSGNLILIDRDGNITIIDRSKKYGIAFDGDNTIIVDENGEIVRVEDGGSRVVYPDGKGGDKYYYISDTTAVITSETTVTTAAETSIAPNEGDGDGGLHSGVIVAVFITLAVAVAAVCILIIIRRRNGQDRDRDTQNTTNNVNSCSDTKHNVDSEN